MAHNPQRSDLRGARRDLAEHQHRDVRWYARVYAAANYACAALGRARNRTDDSRAIPNNLGMDAMSPCPECGSLNCTVTDLPPIGEAEWFDRIVECECGEITTYII
jgi:hypothetical protein